MCGRFVITSPPEAIRRLFGYEDQPNFPPRYNIAPTQPIPAVIIENDVRRFALLRWGLIPAWVKDPRQFTLLINARAETVLEKPAFKNAMKRRRCLVPADGYYEWQALPSRKRPLFVHPADGQLAAFAALAETWTGPNGEEVHTVAIVTVAASADLAPLHHRMPALIAPDHFSQWLDCRAVSDREAMQMLVPPPEGTFSWYEVSSAVNATANDDAQLVEAVSEEEIAAEAAAREAAKTTKKSSSRSRVTKTTANNDQGSLF